MNWQHDRNRTHTPTGHTPTGHTPTYTHRNTQAACRSKHIQAPHRTRDAPGVNCARCTAATLDRDWFPCGCPAALTPNPCGSPAVPLRPPCGPPAVPLRLATTIRDTDDLAQCEAGLLWETSLQVHCPCATARAAAAADGTHRRTEPRQSTRPRQQRRQRQNNPWRPPPLARGALTPVQTARWWQVRATGLRPAEASRGCCRNVLHLATHRPSDPPSRPPGRGGRL